MNLFLKLLLSSFKITNYQNDKNIYKMPVIVGKLHHETPIFSEEIKYVVLNPYWTLTPHIARTETLHKLRNCVQKSGRMNFVRDIYKSDVRLHKAL
jgi:murein L,D-transpeptidase YcbB/YkuD